MNLQSRTHPSHTQKIIILPVTLLTQQFEDLFVEVSTIHQVHPTADVSFSVPVQNVSALMADGFHVFTAAGTKPQKEAKQSLTTLPT